MNIDPKKYKKTYSSILCNEDLELLRSLLEEFNSLDTHISPKQYTVDDVESIKVETKHFSIKGELTYSAWGVWKRLKGHHMDNQEIAALKIYAFIQKRLSYKDFKGIKVDQILSKAINRNPKQD